MARNMSGNRAQGIRLRSDRAGFVPAQLTGAEIASLSKPFGADTAHAVVGAVPPQFALQGNRLVIAAASAVDGDTYAIKVRASSADGKREIAETIVLPCRRTTPVAVLLVMGDSNARGAAADEASLVFTPDPGITTWNGSAFVPYAPGVRTGCTVPGALAGGEGRVGPELEFARAYRRDNPAVPMAIVKYARGGSFQAFGTDAPVNGDAGNSWDPVNGTLFAGARTQLTNALAALVRQGRTPQVIAAIDASGTNDASNTTLAAAVQATKATMMETLRACWPSGSAPMLLVQRVKSDSPQPNLVTVRAAQAAVAHAASDIVLVDSDGFASNPGDATHYAMTGLIALGGAHYAAWANRVNRRAHALGGKLLFLLDAAARTTIEVAAGQPVPAWSAAAGGRSLTQTTATRQPILIGSAIAGAAAADFDGVDDGLSFAGANGLGSGDREGFAIVTSDALAANTANGAIYARGGGADSNDLRLGRTVVSGVSRFRVRAGIGNGLAYQVADTQVVAEGGPFVVMWRISGTTISISVNGQAEQSASLTAPPAIGNSGLFVGQANASQYFDGRIRLVGETTALTAAERAALADDLMIEAGLAP